MTVSADYFVRLRLARGVKPGMDAEALTENRRRFVAEYATDRNATRAYRVAFPGVTYGTAKTEGGRLLTNPDIAAEVAAARWDHLRRCGVSARRVLRELAAIAFADPDDLFREGPGGEPELRPWSDIPPVARAAIQSVKVRRRRLRAGKDDATEWEVETVEVRFHSKDAALDKLARHLGLTRDGAALEHLLRLIEAEGGPGVSADDGGRDAG